MPQPSGGNWVMYVRTRSIGVSRISATRAATRLCSSRIFSGGRPSMMSMRTSGMPAPLVVVARLPGWQPEQGSGGVDGRPGVLPWHPDGRHPGPAGALDVPRHVVEEHDLLRGQAERLGGLAERARIGFHHPGEAGVDDDVEQLQVL